MIGFQGGLTQSVVDGRASQSSVLDLRKAPELPGTQQLEKLLPGQRLSSSLCLPDPEVRVRGRNTQVQTGSGALLTSWTSLATQTGQ